MSLTAGSFIKNRVQLCPSEKNKLNFKKPTQLVERFCQCSPLPRTSHPWPGLRPTALRSPERGSGGWKGGKWEFITLPAPFPRLLSCSAGPRLDKYPEIESYIAFLSPFFFSPIFLCGLSVSTFPVCTSICLLFFFPLFSFFFSSPPPPFPVNPCHIFDSII